MGLDIRKFIKEEGLSIKGFDQWAQMAEPKSTEPKDTGKKLIPKKLDLLRKLLEGLKGEEEAAIILEEMQTGALIVESVGPLLISVRYKNGSLHIPKPMVEVVGKGEE